MAKKKHDKVKEYMKEEAEELRARERELERKIAREVKVGKEMLDEETEEFKKNVRRNPLEYVAGAFIIGLVMGKLLK